jgi:transposase
MNAYSEELRKKKIVEAVQRGMPNTEAARTFGLGISSVKRYVATARAGRSLAPKKPPGSKPKLDSRERGGCSRRTLRNDHRWSPSPRERREFLGRVARVEVSESTVSRMLKRLGWSRKKDRWERQSATSSS